jgi:hypothetical protein
MIFAHAAVTFALPVTADDRVAGEVRHQIFDERYDHVMAVGSRGTAIERVFRRDFPNHKHAILIGP